MIIALRTVTVLSPDEKSLRKLEYDDDYKHEMIIMMINHNEKTVPFSHLT